MRAADEQQWLRDEALQVVAGELEQFGVRFQNRLINRLQLCLGTSNRHSWLEPAHDWQPAVGAILKRLIRVRRHLRFHGDGYEKVRR